MYDGGSEPDPRFSMANERTFLAWVRTGLAFIAAGVGVAVLASYTGRVRTPTTAASALLILCGMAGAVSGLVRWMVTERAIRRSEPLPGGAALTVSVAAVVVVAVVALLLVGG